MDQLIKQLPWDEPDWLPQAQAWIHTQLDRLGLQYNGPAEQIHLRPWSTVLRVPVSGAHVFFKAVMPAMKHEIPLSQAISHWFAEKTLPVLAAEAVRGWLLLPDAGLPLRSRLNSPDYFDLWARALDHYAGMQLSLAPRPIELLDAGAPDRRLEHLPTLLETVLADMALMRINLPDGLSEYNHGRLRACLPAFRQACQRLAEYGLPETLHHDDFHDANIFLSGERILLSDWAESGLAHPFFGLMIALRGIVYRLELSEGAPEVQRLVDGYLSRWNGYAQPVDLQAAFRLSQVIAMANRAITWHQVVSSLPAPYQKDNAGSVTGWLEEFLEHFTKIAREFE